MGDLLRFPRSLRLLSFRRAATPPAAPERQCPTPPREDTAASSSCEVVCLEDRRIPKIPLPWCPLSPYVGAVILGAALASATTAYVAADISTIPARMWASAFAIWSA